MRPALAADHAQPAPRPIVFVSHFRVKPGHEPAIRAMWTEVADAIAADKPRTAAYLAYLDADGGSLSIVHVFPDPASLAAHFAGASERAAAAYAHMDPAGWEVYGAPDPANLAELEASAARAGVQLSVSSEPIGGFLRAPDR